MRFHPLHAQLLRHWLYVRYRSTIDASFILEKYEAAKHNLNMVFVDLEKSVDRIPMEGISTTEAHEYTEVL